MIGTPVNSRYERYTALTSNEDRHSLNDLRPPVFQNVHVIGPAASASHSFEHFVGHASIGFGVRLNHDALTPAELAGDEIIIPVDAPGARLKIVFDSMSRVSGTGV